MASHFAWLPNSYNVRTNVIDLTPYLKRRSDIISLKEKLDILQRYLAA